MKKVSAPISLAGSPLGETRHVRAFFNNDEEEYRIQPPFIGGILQQNPFFVPPDGFLREYRQRRAGRNSSPATV